jgi:hypothetical protein
VAALFTMPVYKVRQLKVMSVLVFVYFCSYANFESHRCLSQSCGAESALGDHNSFQNFLTLEAGQQLWCYSLGGQHHISGRARGKNSLCNYLPWPTGFDDLHWFVTYSLPQTNSRESFSGKKSTHILLCCYDTICDLLCADVIRY